MSTFECPHCHTDIELSEVLSTQVDHQVHEKVQEELSKGKKKLIEEIELKTKKELLKLQEAEIENRKIIWAESYELEKQKSKIDQEQLLAQNEKYKKDLNKLRENELALQKKANESSARLEEIELQNKLVLEAEKLKLQAELKRIQKEENEKLIADFKTASELQTKQDQIMIDSLKKKIDELSRSAKTDGSQRTQGEALELVGEEFLKEKFTADIIEPIKTGANGSDVVHTVKTSRNKDAGKIKWEFKRTKNWNDNFLKKLNDDMANYKAIVGVIVTEALPQEAIDGNGFAQFDNIYVMSIARFKVFAPIIRDIVLKIHRNDAISSATNDMKANLFTHITSLEFTNGLKNLFDYISFIQDELDRDNKRANLSYLKRKKLTEKTISNFMNMYVGLQSVSNQSIPKIEALEIDHDDELEEFLDSAIPLSEEELLD